MKHKSLMLGLIVMVLLLMFVSSAQAATVERLWGQTSPGTSVAISQQAWRTSQAVVVARDDYFTDALTGGPLAYACRFVYGGQAPILLVSPHSLPTEVANEIERLGAWKVYILGGPGAVDSNVEAAIDAVPGVTEITRLGGIGAYGTAEAIRKEIDQLCVIGNEPGPTTGVITTGENFPDAICASAPAARNKMPILLVRPFSSEPIEPIRVALMGLDSSVIVGGVGAVHNTLEDWLNTNGYPVQARFWGYSEYDTAVDIASSGYDYFGFRRNNVFVARGDYFTDALAGGPLASRGGPWPTILVEPNSVPLVSQLWLSGYKSSIDEVYILGGPGAITDSVFDQINDLVN